MVKPFAPDALERAIEEVLGPVQAEVKPKESKVEEVIAMTEEEIPAHLERGQTYFKAGRVKEALREFQSILDINPGHIETRVWIRRAKEELVKPRVEVPEGEGVVEEVVKVKQCIWARMGVVSYRICTRDYDCLTCEFDQTMQEKIATGEASELDAVLERLKELPAPQRVCRYALKGDISYRLCTHLFQCAACEFDQLMQDALAQKLAKLSARREALHKKEQEAKI